MALIKCPDCGNNISSNATVCIHCGRPMRKKIEKLMTTEEFLEEKRKEKNKFDIQNVRLPLGYFLKNIF